ncbi:hypothetical protein N9N67_06740 [Bacteriovoracaceae bacterium]|nr:hypothetical protein [Bacteriovoracaceae bacterium]
MKITTLTLIILSSVYAQDDKLSLYKQVSQENTPLYNEIKKDDSCAGSNRSIHNDIAVDFQYMRIDESKPCFGPNKSEQEKMIYGFMITNTGSEVINPRGKDTDSERTFHFSYQENARQQIKLSIEEIANPVGRISHWHMLSSFYFIPRKVLPYIIINQELNSAEVTLPTKEKVVFNLETKEIISGVFTEKPIDYLENRHRRNFPQISYSGSGYMIRVDQRGELPEADMVWGQKKYATISKNGKTCKVRANLLWDQTGGDSSRFLFKFPTDESFYQFISKKCPKLTK